jgi:hypothetical protein
MSIKSFSERYPTGRKHCSGCKRWRHVVDFSVAKWESLARERPIKLQARCVCCERLRIRKHFGYKPRVVFNPYPPGSKRWQAFRTERKRLRYHELKKDPDWLKKRREYYRFYHNAVGTYNGNTKPDKKLKIGEGSLKLGLDSKKVAEFIDGLIVKGVSDKNQQMQFFINGKVLTDDEGRALRRWRSGRYPKAAIAAVDEWCLKFGIPLWEIEEFAKIPA